MGFLDDLDNLWSEVKSAAKEVATEVKSAAREVATEVKSAAKEVATEVATGVARGVVYVGKKLEQAGGWIDKTISDLGKKKLGPKINSSFISNCSSTTYESELTSEEKEKRARKEENDAIADYQRKIRKLAKEREAKVKKAYLEIYKPYLEDFKEVLDTKLMDEIETHVNDTSRSFTNTLRDEVNRKVNSSYQPWKQITSNHPSPEQLQAYCDMVYADADNNLLDLLQSAIESTNKFISQRVFEYNEDKAKALAEMKKSLVKLTSDEETKAQELKKIAEELAVAQFIANETTIEI